MNHKTQGTALRFRELRKKVFAEKWSKKGLT